MVMISMHVLCARMGNKTSLMISGAFTKSPFISLRLFTKDQRRTKSSNMTSQTVTRLLYQRVVTTGINSQPFIP
jgi:hypothetical protein